MHAAPTHSVVHSDLAVHLLVRTVMHLHKLQRIQIHQTFLHRRRGVAHVALFTAGGSRTVRYLSIDQARELYDYALYRVESFEGSWM